MGILYILDVVYKALVSVNGSDGSFTSTLLRECVTRIKINEGFRNELRCTRRAATVKAEGKGAILFNYVV